MEGYYVKKYVSVVRDQHNAWVLDDLSFKESSPGYQTGLRDGYVNALGWALAQLVKIQEQEVQDLSTHITRQHGIALSKEVK